VTGAVWQHSPLLKSQGHRADLLEEEAVLTTLGMTLLIHDPGRKGLRAVYRCELCSEQFSAEVRRRLRGRDRFCTLACANRFNNRGVDAYPEVRDLILLMYPFMTTRELAEFVGFTERALWRYASLRGLLKDKEWLRERGRGDPWPADQLQRKVHALQILIKGAITQRTKEL
jgi:hypothetical protein